MPKVDVDIKGNNQDALNKLKEVENESKGLGSKISSALLGVGKVVGGAVAAVSAGAVAIGKSAFDAYGEYQQLEGGVQKLFGNMGLSLEEYAAQNGKTTDEVAEEWASLERAQNEVLKNAQNAYKDAGMSQNDYIETVTGFSAALINSLGGDTEKAAELANVAAKSMSDNWNTFGGDFENIKNAYAGFAKQNYTMLDNLKLGYGGTKSEMERLIADANEYGASIGDVSDLSIDSFADIVKAIDLVQQKQNIAGTTAREAGETITGSINMAAAAWENWVAGIANPEADMSQLTANMIEALDTVLANVEPAIQNIATAIVENFPAALEALIGFVQSVGGNIITMLIEMAPTLLETALGMLSQILAGLTEALPTVIEAIGTVFSEILLAVAEWLPEFLLSAVDLFFTLIEALWQVEPQVITAFFEAVGKLIEGLAERAPEFLERAGEFFNNFWAAVQEIAPVVLEGLGELVSGLVQLVVENAPEMLSQAGDFFGGIITAIAENAPSILSDIGEVLHTVISAVVENAPSMLARAVEFFAGILKGILENAPEIISNLGELLGNLVHDVLEKAPEFLSGALELIGQLAIGILQALPDVLGSLGELLSTAVNEIPNWISSFLGMGADLIWGLVSGIQSAAGGVVDAVVGSVADAFNSAMAWLGIASPSKKFRYGIGRYIPLGAAAGIEDEADVVEDSVVDMFDFDVTPSIMAPSLPSFTDIGTATGLQVNVGELAVREEADIFRVSEELYTLIERTAW